MGFWTKLQNERRGKQWDLEHAKQESQKNRAHEKWRILSQQEFEKGESAKNRAHEKELIKLHYQGRANEILLEGAVDLKLQESEQEHELELAQLFYKDRREQRKNERFLATTQLIGHTITSFVNTAIQQDRNRTDWLISMSNPYGGYGSYSSRPRYQRTPNLGSGFSGYSGFATGAFSPFQSRGLGGYRSSYRSSVSPLAFGGSGLFPGSGNRSANLTPLYSSLSTPKFVTHGSTYTSGVTDPWSRLGSLTQPTFH